MKGIRTRLLTVTLIAASALTAVVANANTTAVARWDFNVYLGDKKLGRHTFEVVEENGTKRVVSERVRT